MRMPRRMINDSFRSAILFWIVGIAVSNCVWAQVTKLTSPDQFSEDAFLLTFQELGAVSRGQDASEAYASLGIFLQGEQRAVIASTTSVGYP